jgi:hypothetical protein
VTPEQRQLYEAMLAKPPTGRRQVLAQYFWAGCDGLKGAHQGEPDSLARAAWMAGRTYAKSHNARVGLLSAIKKRSR